MQVEMDFVASLQQHVARFNFSHIGWTSLARPYSFDLYRDWIQAGHHASMSYLERHLKIKETPSALLPRACSAIVIAKGYWPHPYPEAQPFEPRTALYAAGGDYHFDFQNELEQVAADLQVMYPNEQFLCFTDSAPILERDLAVKAGLGWVGKNACVIHPKKGSLFFIGEILSTLVVPESPAQIPDLCGTCDRCLKACPTQAFESPRVLNSSKCIAYWTIEARAPAPENLREKFGDWFFGCDICQTVCPWNEKVFGRELMRERSKTPQTQKKDLICDLREILNDSPHNLRTRFQDRPLTRARALGLKRNALYVIGNLQLHELRAEVQQAQQNQDLLELAKWALQKLESGSNDSTNSSI